MSVTVVEFCKLPDVPVKVTVYVPDGVEDDVDTLIVEVPDPVTDVGLNVAVAPVGNPLALSATLPLNPLKAVTVPV